MILVLIIVSAAVLFMFIVRIASPIQYMINLARKMSEGDLSIRIDVKTRDEIAILGRLINDLSVNLQEVVAQMERMVHNLERALEIHEINVRSFPNIRSYMDEETELLRKIVKEFRLLKDAYTLFTIESMIGNMNNDKGPSRE